MKRLLPVLSLVFVLGIQTTLISVVSANGNLWETLKSGNHIALIRHALAPGFSDPDDFSVKDCSTQRNLNNVGRNQARIIGNQFRAVGIHTALVYSSQWCRCLETASLLELGPVNELISLNSFFKNANRRNLQTDVTKSWITRAPLTIPTVLITHQVNITALTGYMPSSGEIVFVKRSPDGRLSTVGAIQTPK